MGTAALASLASLTLLALGPRAAGGPPQDRLKFDERRREVVVEAGDRHLELGLWCRDRGLTTQAAAEFVHAVEISEGQHWHAKNVLAFMRRYDDAFWKKRKRGTAANRKSYEIKAERAREKDAKEMLGLAEWAWRKSFEEEALEIYVGQVRERGNELVFDAKGRLVLEHGTVPAEAAVHIREMAVEIDGKLYLGNEINGALSDLNEVAGEALRVRGPLDAARLEELQAVGLALMPHLEEALEARPARRLDVFVFPTREGYEAWCSGAGLAAYVVAEGFADIATGTAILCTEGKDDDAVAALLLHELTHLYWYSVTPTAMPDWFSEGFAETWSGQGTFTWDGVELTFGGLMSDFRLAPLRTDRGLFSLRELLEARALDLWATDRERALVFYAQAWALHRYLQRAAPEDVRADFELWVAMCAGSAAGADSLRARQRDSTPAAALFQDAFGPRLGAIEEGFRAWLTTL